MDSLDNPAVWGLIWIGLAATLAVIEIVAIGGFFLVPFAIGALVAAVISFLGAPIPIGFAAFVIVSLGTFYLLRPLAKRMELNLPNPIGVGANRLIGHTGQVLEDIPQGLSKSGMVQIAGERWRAEGRDGMGIMARTPITIIEVKGTRVIVEPITPEEF